MLVLFPCAQAAKLKLPSWLAEASQRQAPLEKDTSAIVLHDEEICEVSSSGRMTTKTRRAVRVVTRDGRSSAGAIISYDSSTDKVTSFKAWLVRPDGEGKTYAKNDTVDIAASSEAVYAESREVRFSAYADAFEDCVFACEYTVEDKGVFGQNIWSFHTTQPVALSRVTYKIPKGWSLVASMINHAPVQPVVKGNTHTWELRDLPAFKIEPLSPSPSKVAPRMNIDLMPPPDMRNPPRITFPDWKAVSLYNSALYVKPSTPDATVGAKTRELLAAAGPGLWERIDALARHAQGINYVQIAMNVGRGGGYTPRNAAEVLRTGYGDCKDKTALLRAMLTAAGIESHAVTAYSGDRYFVTEAWPTPMQFNHAIIAIKIDDPSISSPMIVEHPALGRLLFFDPTDPYTPLGDLDYNQQGSLVFVLAGENGGLVRLPFTSPMANHLDRTITAQVFESGSIGGRIVEQYTGQAAARSRAIHRLPRVKFDEVIRGWVNDTVRAAKISKVDAVDEQQQGRFKMTVDFAAPGYGQSMRGKLLIFKPAIVSRRDFVPLTKPERTHPVVLEPRSYSELSDIYIPRGFQVDELPPLVETATPFGSYKAVCTYDAATHHVKYQRTLVMNAAEIPAADYASVRDFFETIRKAEQTPVVLSKEQ
ncbi:transglutaminase-like putative cysteine protease [Ereboglobus sp. PH5-5]|uniref:DUF3857 domain-containing transglutaminase family protein n=1 Tax=Ereboglobus sp. PH5-5 TaxID=2940529 RepID=UPI002406CAA3|nr:DUF3857 domain-containing transglutaminase family protein [Ereboglobus sp. PH5-5]MDF9832981.1 transglutaminase-like putative cysteine protease [Ereboglobus sp. PH5-5]